MRGAVALLLVGSHGNSPASGSAGPDSGSGWSFSASVAPDLQTRLFGPALGQGWLGADLALSVPLGPGRHLWLFGDSYVGDVDRDGGVLCNGAEALSCAMVPQSVGISSLSSLDAGLNFSWGRDPSTRRPLPMVPVPEALQPASVRGRHCPDCSCTPALAGPHQGSCNETSLGNSNCCHTMDYMWLLSALATPDGSQLVFLADIVRDNATRVDLGWCRGTMAVVVEDPRGPPESWRYTMEPVPQTGPFCSDTNWFAAMAWAAPDGEADDIVYVLGVIGMNVKRQVLARVPMASLLSFDWSAWEYWCGEAHGGWKKTETCVETLELDGQTEATLQWHPNLKLWVIPTAGSACWGCASKLYVWTAQHATGPWIRHNVTDFPSFGKGWGFRTAKSHPELAEGNEIIVSVIPVAPGVNREPASAYFPHLWRITVQRV